MKRRMNRRPTIQENRLAPCRLKCGMHILFIRTVRFDEELQRYTIGDYMPCNPELLTGNDERTLVAIYPVEMRGVVVPKASETIQGYEPHFGSCINYEANRRRREAKAHRSAQLSLF